MKSFRTLLPFLRPYRAGIAAGLALVVVANGFGVATPKVLGAAIDALGRPGATVGTLLEHAALLLGVALAAGAARYGMRELLNGISRRVEVDLRDALFDHLLRLDAGFYGRMRTGDLMSRATNDAQAVRMAAGPAIMYLANTVVATGLALVLMVRTSPRLTALALLPLVALPPVAVVFGRAIHDRFERIQDHFGALSTLVQENLAGVRVVRAYVQEAAQEREFDRLNRQYLEKNMALVRVSGAFHPLLGLLAGLGAVAVLWFGGREAMAGRITVGEFVAFGFYLGMLTWPMIALGWVINLFQRGAASMGRIAEILAVPAPAAPADAVRPAAVRGEVEFRDVWFRYPGAAYDALRGVSFRIPAGTTAALVGPTGSGKSTVAALLARVYEPTAGEILVDGVPVERLDARALRAAIGFVPQEAFVFSETVEENIAFGLAPEAVDRGRVRAAAAVARLEEVIAGLPAGYQTRVGERGVTLSGGQRQRVTLARALARDPRILVLDDALSAVDTHTEAEILAGLRGALAGRTVLVISHRASAVAGADQILVLEAGRIVERGTHGELLARGGVYAALVRRQVLEEALEGAEPEWPAAAARRA